MGCIHRYRLQRVPRGIDRVHKGIGTGMVLVGIDREMSCI